MVLAKLSSTRHTKITGDFGENTVLYWLSKHGFESAMIDHTGIDILARNPKTNELMGISVKSRSTKQPYINVIVNRNKNKRDENGETGRGDREKILDACKAFGCNPYIAIVHDDGTGIDIFIVSLDTALGYSKNKDDVTWGLSDKKLREYDNDPNVFRIRMEYQLKNWW